MKKGYIPTIISLVAILLALWGLRGQATTTEEHSTFEKALSDDKLTVCYVTWPPTVIKDPQSGELSGFLIDAIEKIAENANLRLEYVETSWGGFPADLASHKCDVGVAGFYPMINRSTSVSFTAPFLYAGNNGVVRSDDDRFESTTDLNKPGVKIAVIQGEYGMIYARKHWPKADLVVLEQNADETAPLVAVSSGQADIGLFTDNVITDYIERHKEVKKLFEEPYSVTPMSWVTRKDDQQLLNFLNNGLTYLESTGDLKTMAEQYDADTLYMLDRKFVPAGK